MSQWVSRIAGPMRLAGTKGRAISNVRGHTPFTSLPRAACWQPCSIDDKCRAEVLEGIEDLSCPGGTAHVPLPSSAILAGGRPGYLLHQQHVHCRRTAGIVRHLPGWSFHHHLPLYNPRVARYHLSVSCDCKQSTCAGPRPASSTAKRGLPPTDGFRIARSPSDAFGSSTHG